MTTERHPPSIASIIVFIVCLLWLGFARAQSTNLNQNLTQEQKEAGFRAALAESLKDGEPATIRAIHQFVRAEKSKGSGFLRMSSKPGTQNHEHEIICFRGKLGLVMKGQIGWCKVVGGESYMLLGAGAGIPIVLSGSAYYGWIKTTGPRRSSFAGYYEFAEFAVSHGYGAGMLMGHLSDDPTVQLFMFGVEVGVSFDGTVNFIHLL